MTTAGVLAGAMVGYIVAPTATVTMPTDPGVIPSMTVWEIHGGRYFGIPFESPVTVDPRFYNHPPHLACTAGDFPVQPEETDGGGFKFTIHWWPYEIVHRPGDVNADGAVNLTDVAAVKAMDGQAVSNETCKYDVNLDGRINMTDMAKIRQLTQ
jgi:hypothetical protein